jgi:UDP-N-acetylmuramoylalanine-D-glutamate ligase
VKKLIEKEFQYCLKLSLQPLTDATIIGIMGSNGKTTTTMLTYHVLKSAGLNVGLGGNIGKSFAWQIADNKYDLMCWMKRRTKTHKDNRQLSFVTVVCIWSHKHPN